MPISFNAGAGGSGLSSSLIFDSKLRPDQINYLLNGSGRSVFISLGKIKLIVNMV